MINSARIFILFAGLSATIMLMSCMNKAGNDPLPRPEPPTRLSVQNMSNQVVSDTHKIVQTYKVTFIELGSVRCVPCRKMQPVMKSIEEKYGDQVKVVFHDVWTKEGEPFGDKYGIKAIPAQVFLDEDGKEFFRHEGFFSEEELIKVLKSKGVK